MALAVLAPAVAQAAAQSVVWLVAPAAEEQASLPAVAQAVLQAVAPA